MDLELENFFQASTQTMYFVIVQGLESVVSCGISLKFLNKKICTLATSFFFQILSYVAPSSGCTILGALPLDIRSTASTYMNNF
jgi:hypothetical protein